MDRYELLLQQLRELQQESPSRNTDRKLKVVLNELDKEDIEAGLEWAEKWDD